MQITTQELQELLNSYINKTMEDIDNKRELDVETINDIEDKFAERILQRLNQLGYDTSICDGDTDPAEILADWFHNTIQDSIENTKYKVINGTSYPVTYTDQQIITMAEHRYGNDPYLYAKQRDGFVEGFKEGRQYTLNNIR